jgi:hypothetical protein
MHPPKNHAGASSADATGGTTEAQKLPNQNGLTLDPITYVK